MTEQRPRPEPSRNYEVRGSGCSRFVNLTDRQLFFMVALSLAIIAVLISGANWLDTHSGKHLALMLSEVVTAGYFYAESRKP